MSNLKTYKSPQGLGHMVKASTFNGMADPRPWPQGSSSPPISTNIKKKEKKKVIKRNMTNPICLLLKVLPLHFYNYTDFFTSR